MAGPVRTRRQRRSVLRPFGLLAVAGLLAGVLSVVPLPRLVWETGYRVDRTIPVLRPLDESVAAAQEIGAFGKLGDDHAHGAPRVVGQLASTTTSTMVASSTTASTGPSTTTPAPVTSTSAPRVHEHGSEDPSAEAVPHRHTDDEVESRSVTDGRLEGGESGIEPFTTIGVTFEETPGEPVLLRVRADGHWQDWTEIEVNPDEAPDPHTGEGAADGRVGTAPVWVGSADAYELNVAADSGDDDPEVLLVRETREQVRIEEATPEAGAEAGRPWINPRSSWGARPPNHSIGTAADLELGIVHHSVTGNDYSASEVPGILRSIQAFHMDGRGWYDIAYNFAVDRFGRVWEARSGGVDQAVIGGHSRGFNTGATGVVVLGDYSTGAPSSAAVDAVGELLGWKMAIHHLEPDTSTVFTSLGGEKYPEGAEVSLNTIVGHRDVSATGCPGGNLYPQLGRIRSVARARHAAVVASAPPGQLLTGDFDGDGHADALSYAPDTFADTWIRGTDNGVEQDAARVRRTYTPLEGDFDGDGRGDLLWYGRGSVPDSVWYGERDDRVTTWPVSVRGADYRPEVGDFDGDGNDDVFWYGPGGVSDSVWYGLDGRGFELRSETVRGWYTPVVGDFDDDDHDDIFWYGRGEVGDYLWWGRDEPGFTSMGQAVRSPWYEPFVGDFDGAEGDDLFWYLPGSGPDFVWSSTDERGVFDSEEHPVRGRYEPHVGNFDGDRRDDVLWYRPGPADDYTWYGTFDGFSSRHNPVSGQYHVGVGDIDDDGRDDVLWYRPGTANDYWWEGRSGRTFGSEPAG